MSTLTASLHRGAGEFFEWWFGELNSLIPTSLKRAMHLSDRAVEIRYEGANLTITKRENGRREVVGSIGDHGGTTDFLHRELGRITHDLPDNKWQYGILLPDNQILRDVIRLPAAAGDNLHDVVSLQLERHTPFRRSEVCFACRVVGSTGPMIDVEIHICRREDLDSAVRRLRELDISVGFVAAESQSDGEILNLLPSEERGSAKGAAWLNPVLCFVVIALGSLAIWMPIERDKNTAEFLSQRVEILRSEARSVASRVAELDAAEKQLGYVAAQKSQSPSFVKVLNDLTVLLPDDAWTSRLSFVDGEISVVVHAPESSTILRMVEESPAFSDAKMLSAARPDADTGREKFRLSFATPASRESARARNGGAR